MSLTHLAACADPIGPASDLDPGRAYVVSPVGVRIHGTSRILVIPARFADGPASPLTSANLAAQLFGGANGGPLARTFGLASGGSFRLLGEVTPWVTTSITRAASSKPGIFTESGAGDHALLALQAVDPLVDFGRYDNDGPDGRPNSGDDDGVVDGGVVLLHSEPNLYCDPTGRGTHPHSILQWRPNGTRFQTLDAASRGGVIEVGAYVSLSATGCTTGTVQTHVVAHELGHLLFGLPDLYRTGGVGVIPPPEGLIGVWSTRRWVVGCWELMAAGSWGCGAGTPAYGQLRSAGLGAWARYRVGWATPVNVDRNRDSTYALQSLARGGTVLRIPIAADEYLLVEYREQLPGDETVPANGVLIYRVAESLAFYPTSPVQPNHVQLVEADDDSALDRTEVQGGNRGTPDDAFGVSRSTFRPGEHSQAVGLDGTPLPFAISEIRIDAPNHRAWVRVAPAGAFAATRGGVRR